MTRPYDSPVRRARAADTRDRIVTAGAELLHRSPIWNWRALTVRAVAAKAAVSERTVYRHFGTERDLRDAVLARLEEEAGIDLRQGIALEDVAPLTARMFEFVSSFPLEPRTPRDETVAAASARQRDALVGAVAASTTGWDARDRVAAAAVLDVLWSVVSYERLVDDWALDPKEAIRALTWAIGLVEDAVRTGQAP